MKNPKLPVTFKLLGVMKIFEKSQEVHCFVEAVYTKFNNIPTFVSY